MPARSTNRRTARPEPRRTARRPQLEVETPLLALAAARSVVEEAAVHVGRPLSARYAARLAHRARRVYAHSDSFRRKVRASGDRGRDWLHVFLRHWLAALLLEESPTYFSRLPAPFANGEASPAATSRSELTYDSSYESNEVRQIIGW